jgi:hypothetical protein
MEGEKAEIFEVNSAEAKHQCQTVLANYEFKQGKKLVFQSSSANARYIIALGEFVRCRDKRMDYSSVDYEGEKDLFRVELKFYKK